MMRRAGSDRGVDREVGASWAAAACTLLVALVAATMLRTVLVEVNGAAGRMWPFSLTHCASAAAPGCSGSPRQAWGVRAGGAG